MSAHDLSQSESVLEIDAATVRVRFTINLLELPDVDANRDQRVSYDELDRSIERIFAAIKAHYVLRAGGDPTRVVMARQEIVDDHVLRTDLVYTFPSPVRRIDVESTLDRITSPAHVHLARAPIGGETNQALLTPANRSVTFLVPGFSIARLAAVLATFLLLGAVVWLLRRPPKHEVTK